MNRFDRFCPRCKREYNDIDNYGMFACATHVGELRTNDKGRIYYTCCPQNTKPVDYHPTGNKVTRRNFGFNYRCSRIRLPPPCTPCDHGDILNENGTHKTITFEEYYNDKLLPNMTIPEANARIQLLIANGALPQNADNETEIFRIQMDLENEEEEDISTESDDMDV